MLTVVDHPGAKQPLLVAHLSWNNVQEPTTYRDDQIELPAKLKKAIAEARIQDIASDLMSQLLDTPDSDNPAIKVVAWCDTLRHGFAQEELGYLVKDLEVYGGELGILHEEHLEELRRLKATFDDLRQETTITDEV